MDKKETKPFKTYWQQVDLLIERGLLINDKDRVARILSQVNYYRFVNAYGLEFIDKSVDRYKDGTRFDDLYIIYEFDRQLRHILFGYIEQAEIKLRTAIAYCSGQKYGAMGYCEGTNFDSRFDISKFLDTINREIRNQGNSDCIRHHKKKYSGIPIWVMVEFMTFGTLSNMFKHMKKDDKVSIIGAVIEKNPPKPYYFDSWFHKLVDVRNICAHYGRIYNRYFDNPKIVTTDNNLKELLNVNRLFPILVPLIKLLDDSNANKLMNDLAELIDSYPGFNIARLGFPTNWDLVLQEALSGNI